MFIIISGPLEDRVAIAELNGIYADGVVPLRVQKPGVLSGPMMPIWDLMGHQTRGKDAIVRVLERRHGRAGGR